jgi:hypothetical protein
MAWTTVANFQLTTDWQITDVLPTGSFFQINHDNAPTGGLYIIAQVELIDDSNKMRMCDSQSLIVDPKCSDIVRLPKPGFYTNRRIAIKRLPALATLESELKRLLIPNILQPIITINSVQLNKWSIKIEVSDYVETTNTSGSGSSTPAEQAIDLNYISDGDTNGVFYYLGTNRKTVSFINPSSANIVAFNQINALNEDAIARNLADRDPNTIAHTQDTQNAWFSVDLKEKKLIVNRFSLKARQDINDHNPRNLKLQGSQDNINWIDLYSLAGNVLNNASWHSPQVVSQSTAYRYFRLLQTGQNSANLYYFVLAEWELYGKLIG